MMYEILEKKILFDEAELTRALTPKKGGGEREAGKKLPMTLFLKNHFEQKYGISGNMAAQQQANFMASLTVRPELAPEQRRKTNGRREIYCEYRTSKIHSSLGHQARRRRTGEHNAANSYRRRAAGSTPLFTHACGLTPLPSRFTSSTTPGFNTS